MNVLRAIVRMFCKHRFVKVIASFRELDTNQNLMVTTKYKCFDCGKEYFRTDVLHEQTGILFCDEIMEN